MQHRAWQAITGTFSSKFNPVTLDNTGSQFQG